MLRTVIATTTLAAALTAAAFAQSRTQGFGRAGSAWCNDGGNGDRASFCEVREETISGVNPLDVDAGRNGGIRVRGWDRGDVLVRARIVGYADTDAEARRVVSGVRLVTAGGSVRAEGPDGGRDAHWSVSFEIQVPRTALLTLNTNNGGISIEDFQGTAKFRAHNGGVSLNNVSGDIRGADDERRREHRSHGRSVGRCRTRRRNPQWRNPHDRARTLLGRPRSGDDQRRRQDRFSRYRAGNGQPTPPQRHAGRRRRDDPGDHDQWRRDDSPTR